MDVIRHSEMRKIRRSQLSRRVALLTAVALGFVFGYFAAVGFFAEPKAVASDALVTSPAGLYFVHGRAIDSLTGQSQLATGSITIRQRGQEWVSSFEIGMDFDREDGRVSAEIVGTGSGEVEGNVLRGSSTQQLITASIPGVSTHFPLIPRAVGARVETETTRWIGEDGSIAMEFSSDDEDAKGTIAFLSGYRVNQGPQILSLQKLAVSMAPLRDHRHPH